jgi:starvation-inducible DNA-binding protein
MADHVLSPDHHPTLRHPEREALGTLLQSTLVVLSDLALTGKHAHWNVIGPHFRPLHQLLDEMISRWRDAADRIAERAVALGHYPDGRASTIAACELPQLDTGPQRDHELIKHLTEILTQAIARVRHDMERADEFDPVTGDLYHGVVADLEEQLWMIRAQLA